MAVDFINKKKKQKYLLIAAVIITIIALIILWFGYFRDSDDSSGIDQGEVFVVKRRINIKYDVLENPILKKLEPFEKIPEYEGELGKVNPFLSR